MLFEEIMESHKEKKMKLPVTKNPLIHIVLSHFIA